MPFEDPDQDGAGFRRRADLQMRDAYQAFAAKFQLVLDETLQSHGGRPAAEIRPVLAERWSAVNGAALGEPRLTDYSEAMAEGRRVALHVDGPPDS